MYVNKIKQKLNRAEVVSYVMVKGGPGTVEILGKAGVDGVMIDAQHTDLGISQIQELIRAAECSGIVPMIRISEVDHNLITRYMGIGAMGVLVPDVRSPEQVKAAVNAVKFPPVGTRGLSSTRSSDYGLVRSDAEYVKMSNEQTTIFIIIEHPEGVEYVEEILAVGGVDAVAVGTTDLALSMGHPGEPKHPEVEAAVERVRKACRAAGVNMSAKIRYGRTIESCVEQGYRVLSYTVDAWIKNAAKKMVQEIREVELKRYSKE